MTDPNPPRPIDRPVPAAAAGEFYVFADGASRGNPGDAAIGAVLTDAEGRIVEAVSERIGRTTNNVAEYRALIAGLDAAARHNARSVRIRMDSELIVRQLTGQYKVKHPDMKALYDQVRQRLGAFPKVAIGHVPRAKNRYADALANAALDGRNAVDAIRSVASPAPAQTPVQRGPAGKW